MSQQPAAAPEPATVNGRLPRVVVVAALTVTPVAVLVATFVGWRDRLPDPLPTNWGMEGEVTGTSSVTGLFTSMLVVAAIGVGLTTTALVARWRELPGGGARVMACIGTSACWFAAGIWLTTGHVALDHPQADGVEQPTWEIAVLLLSVAAVAVAAFAVVGRPPQQRRSAARPDPRLPRTDVPDSGDGVLYREAGYPPRVAWLAGPVLLFVVAAVLGYLITAWVAVPLVVFAVVLALMLRTEVTVDHTGLRVRFGPFGWPRVVVALSEVAAADVVEIRPAEWGGWGYRVIPLGRAVILRRGPGVRLGLTERRRFEVTSDRPEELAGIINTLIDRQRPVG